MKMLSKLILVLLPIVSLAACPRQEQVLFLPHQPNSNTESVRPTKESEKDWERIFFRLTSERMFQIGFPMLKEKTLSAGSKEIRVWTSFAFSSAGVLILERTDSKWKAIYLPPTDSADYKSILPKELDQPKSGWDKLIEKLDKLNIEQMPDMSELELGPLGPDLEVVVIEVRNSDGYRNYMYQGLELDRISRMEYPKKVREIISVLSDEFGLDMYGLVPTK